MATGTESEYVCERCYEPVQYGARKCQHCGHSVMAKNEARQVGANLHSIAKWICYLTIIGIPLGLWFRRGERKRAAAKDAGLAVPRSDVN